ncbi:hypothetical protein C8T65DRAFT_638884, partial [Cerioporus squamosus]
SPSQRKCYRVQRPLCQCTRDLERNAKRAVKAGAFASSLLLAIPSPDPSRSRRPSSLASPCNTTNNTTSSLHLTTTNASCSYCKPPVPTQCDVPTRSDAPQRRKPSSCSYSTPNARFRKESSRAPQRSRGGRGHHGDTTIPWTDATPVKSGWTQRGGRRQHSASPRSGTMGILRVQTVQGPPDVRSLSPLFAFPYPYCVHTLLPSPLLDCPPPPSVTSHRNLLHFLIRGF